MFPPIEPFATGYLPVSDGNEIYWEACGSPIGKPALHLHGGPGGGIMTGHRRRYDPDRFMTIAFEQRGCGRSRPLATDPSMPLSTNTTQALIADIELLRIHLGVEKWLLTGLSWGTTLALAYAQAHPDRVSEITLMAVTATTAAEVEWTTEAMGRIFPEQWAIFEHASGRKPGQRIIDAFYDRITDPDSVVQEAAALAWCNWEDTHISLIGPTGSVSHFEDPVYRQVFATLVIHYWKNAAFLGEAGLLAGMEKLAGIPGVLIHGRMDVSLPVDMAWKLHRAWPGSELIVVENEGHGGEVMIDELFRAIARSTPND